jgi:O-antigen chain-terminating methyltransferase
MAEMLRILKRGGKLILTVPFGRFVDYGWFINYDSVGIERLLSSSRTSAIQADYFQYTLGGWMPCSADDLRNTVDGDNGAPAAAGVACFDHKTQGRVTVNGESRRQRRMHAPRDGGRR